MGEIVMMQNYETYREALRQELAKQADSFVRTGYLLRLAMDTDILKDSGYSNVNEFAKGEFGIDASTVSRYININMRFSEGGNSERIAEQYAGIGYAKLSLMLLLPDTINEEISAEYSKAEVQAIKEEVEEEKKVSDLEVLMEGQKQEQAELETNLQRAVHQLMHDEKELFVRIWEIPDGLEDDAYYKKLYDIMAPQGESCYSIRIQGIGRLMLFVKGLDKMLTLTNIRTNEKEEYSWLDLEMAMDKLTFMLPGEDWLPLPAREAWSLIYGEPEEEEEEEIAPVQPPKEKKPEPRKESKVKKAPAKKPEPAAVVEPEEEQPAAAGQVEGQTSIEKDFPQYMPEPEEPENVTAQSEIVEPEPEEGQKEPENVIKTECEGILEYVRNHREAWDRIEDEADNVKLSLAVFDPEKTEDDETMHRGLQTIYKDAVDLAASIERLMMRKEEE